MSPRKGDRSSQLKIGLPTLISVSGGFTRSTAYRWPVVCAISTLLYCRRCGLAR
jgi:hypothetical protein